MIRLSSSNPNPFETGRLRLGQQGADTLVLLRGDDGFDRTVLTLQGVTATDLTPANFAGVPYGIDNSFRLSDGPASSLLSGGPLDDRIFGNGGADTISGLAGNDQLAGGADADSLEGGYGNDWLAGQEGHDLLLGGPGSDILAGGTGDDVLVGGNEGDILSGDGGDDSLDGDSGDDVYKFALGDGRDSLVDASGIDRIEFAAGIAPSDLKVVQQGGDLVLRVGQDGDRITITGALNGASTRIEVARFADGTEWSWAEIVARSMVGTSDDDLLTAIGIDESAANLLVNGSFEIGSDSGGQQSWWGWSYPVIPGWTDASSARFELVDSGHTNVYSTDGGRWLDLDGAGVNMNIYQLVSGFTAGQALLLRFDHANRAGTASGGFEVLWNNAVVATYIDSGTTLVGETLLLGAVAGDNRLGFSGIGTVDSLGALLDNVRLQSVSVTPLLVPLSGGAGNDSLTGSYRADLLNGGSGNDLLKGGTGDDSYRFARGDGQDAILDSDGANVIQFAAGIAPADLRIVQGLPTVVLEIIGSGDRIDLGSEAVPDMGIQRVEFADGIVWTAADLVAMALAPTWMAMTAYRGAPGWTALRAATATMSIASAGATAKTALQTPAVTMPLSSPPVLHPPTFALPRAATAAG